MLQKSFSEQLFTDMPEEGREAWLEEVVKNYPYFSLAHYFLLREKGGLESAPFQAAKTSLHFSHPFLLQERLQNEHMSAIANSSIFKDQVERKERDAEPAVETAEVKEEQHLQQDIKDEQPDRSQKVQENGGLKAPETLTELVFEPLHTTDYFASQGIRLSEEMLSQDKLGKQMKSFTDWLKTMKRIPGATDQVPVDVSVKAFAENSNREEEVFTESMADVYIEQQKFQKARDIYTKLSLLNPSKSAYFAAKLEKIKDN